MNCFVETYSRLEDARIIRLNQTFRILDIKEARSFRNKTIGYSPCVYLLFGNDSVVYVGRSSCPSSRISAHLNGGNSFDAVMLIVLDQPGASYNLDRIEHECIKLFRPKRNIVGNPDYIKNGSSWVYLPDQTTERTA